MDDDVHGINEVEVILRVMHGRLWTGVATLDEMNDWALVCDYFDCGEALREWALTVVPALGKVEEVVGEAGGAGGKKVYIGGIEHLDRWIYVACMFRLDEVFEMLTRFAVLNGARTGDRLGVYVLSGGTTMRHFFWLTPGKVISK